MSNAEAIVLDARSSEVSRARSFVDEVLRAHCLGSRADEVVLATSELFTNAVLHASGPVEVRLRTDPPAIHLEVNDPEAGCPTPTRPGPDAVSGRGLAMVASLSDAWGVTPRGTGKSVWCEFLL